MTDLEHIERNVRELARLREQRQHIDDQIAALIEEHDTLWLRVQAQHTRVGVDLEEAMQS